MARNGRLSSSQCRAISALLSSRTVGDAASQAEVGVRSLHRWLKEDPHFQTALAEAESQAISAASRMLVSLADRAVDVIEETMEDLMAGPAVRLRAAQSTLDYLLRLREVMSLEARVASLERRLAQTGDAGRSKAALRRR